MTFTEFWESGPWKKEQRMLAAKRFAKIPESQYADLLKARDNYAVYCKREKAWYHPVYGSVFLGDRKGWMNWLPTEEQESQPMPLLEASGDFKSHYCDACSQPHFWDCKDKLCTMPKDLICKAALNSIL